MVMWIGKRRLQDIGDSDELKLVAGSWYIDNTAVDATAAEINAIAGNGLSAAELAVLDGVTAGTVTAGKAIVTTTNKHIDALVISDGGLALGSGAGTAVTSTAAELNVLDGISATLTAAELSIMDGVTATTAEINKLAGTAAGLTAAELSILDGVTSTTAELNILDGVTKTAAQINLMGMQEKVFLYDFSALDGAQTRNEVQTLTIDATGGTFTAAWDGGAASAGQAENITSADLQITLRALHADLASITVTGDGPHTITFAGAAVTNQPIGLARLIFDGSSLTGGTGASCVVTTAGSTGIKTLTDISAGALTIPDNACIESAYCEAIDTTTSGGAATITLGITGNADLFVAATAMDNALYAAGGYTALTKEIPAKMTGAVSVIATIADAALTAGIFRVHVNYKEGA